MFNFINYSFTCFNYLESSFANIFSNILYRITEYFSESVRRNILVQNNVQFICIKNLKLTFLILKLTHVYIKSPHPSNAVQPRLPKLFVFYNLPHISSRASTFFHEKGICYYEYPAAELCETGLNVIGLLAKNRAFSYVSKNKIGTNSRHGAGHLRAANAYVMVLKKIVFNFHNAEFTSLTIRLIPSKYYVSIKMVLRSRTKSSAGFLHVKNS